jgi:hypothetical protein
MILSRIYRVVAKTYTLLHDYCSDTVHCTVRYTVQYSTDEPSYFPIPGLFETIHPHFPLSLFLAIILSVARRLDTLFTDLTDAHDKAYISIRQAQHLVPVCYISARQSVERRYRHDQV